MPTGEQAGPDNTPPKALNLITVHPHEDKHDKDVQAFYEKLFHADADGELRNYLLTKREACRKDTFSSLLKASMGCQVSCMRLCKRGCYSIRVHDQGASAQVQCACFRSAPQLPMAMASCCACQVQPQEHWRHVCGESTKEVEGSSLFAIQHG